MRFRKFAYPYVIWLAIFIVVPLILVLYYSISVKSGALSLSNYEEFFTSNSLEVLIDSLRIAFLTTLLCLILGYPVAYFIAKSKASTRSVLLLLVVIPMWMNFLLRTYAWMSILGKNGLLNMILSNFGLGPYNLLYTDRAIILGMVYNFLPFMILPIYTVVEKMDKSLLEAAADLGASPWKTFQKVVFPMSLPGVVTGIIMVFIPAISTFEISALLGGNKYNLIGNLIEHQFRYAGDRHYGSAMSMILMIFIVLSMIISRKLNPNNEESGGSGLW